MDTSVRNRTVVGVFDDYATAQRAVEELVANGFSRDEVEINSAGTYAGEAARGNVGASRSARASSGGGGVAGFFRRLFSADLDDDDRAVYREAVRRGGAVVCVTADDNQQDHAADIMNRNGAVDIDRRVAAWRERGYQGYDESAPWFTEDEIARERQYYMKDTGERTIPVVNEEVRVGKRAVQRGGVRVYTRVREEPVEQKVELREEHIRVDRRSADRAASEADFRNRDEVIEVTEMAEEPVIEKRTRVVEEVVVGKESTSRTETVRDTVRRSDVEVEQIGARDLDDDFRADFKKRYGSMRTAKYEMYAPAYQYGYRMASDERYRGRNWDEIETDLRTDYERTNPSSKWEQIKDAVRYGWYKVTGRR